MAETSQKINKEEPQISAIDKQDQNQSSDGQTDNAQDTNNVLPLTHARYVFTNVRKKKKHRKKVRKHSPEYYEQLKAKKLNKKLEQKWDSHFINDQIPDLYEKKGVSRRTLAKLINEKRSGTALNNKVSVNKTVEIGFKKQTMPLPKIQKLDKRSKSFNIHVVTHKNQHPQINQKNEEPSTLIQAKLSQPNSQKQKRISQQSKQPMPQTKYLQEYKKSVNDLFEEKKFMYCHKEMLESFFDKIDKINVRRIIDKELSSISKNESIINKLMNAIQHRQSFLDRVKHAILETKNNEKQNLEIIDHYRTSTLAVVEEILKWKQAWQAIYFDIFKKTKNFDVIYKTQNYLLTLASSTDQILQQFHQNNEKQHKQQTLKTEQMQVILKTETKDQTAKTQQRQQKQSTEQKQQGLVIDPTKQQTNNQYPSDRKVAQVIKEDKNQPSSKIHLKSQQKTNEISNLPKAEQKVKDQQSIRVEKLTASNQQVLKKKLLKVVSNDPFLISLYDIEKEDKNIILKIRACELLLIQQQFNFFKK